ncbi:capsule biosynthesis protein [Parasaccharibacter sp. TMW 2.1888]|nr:capsule biosynthesis protein [Parasaccharibacter sp. TMW 2.1888]
MSSVRMIGEGRRLGDTASEVESEGRMISSQERNIELSSGSAKSTIRYLGEYVVNGLIMKVPRWFRKQWMFSVVVLFPTLLVASYLWFFASPQYVSETHFLVRGKSLNSSGFGGMVGLLEANHGGTQDTYAVQDYMMSRDALRMLIQKVDLRAVFSRSYADFLAKFPSIVTRNDFESFYSFYLTHVKAQIDEETGISHLKVRTFSAEDSQKVAQALLDAGEKLVNEMNDRQRYNTLHAVQSELDVTLKELHETEMQLAAYRYSNETIDPMKQAVPMMGTALSLEATLSMMEAEKKQLDLTAPHSPLRKVYAQRIASIQTQMKNAQAHITGHEMNSGSLVPKLLGYDELAVKKTIIEKKLAAETTALEMAKAQADRQMLYVTVVAQPSLPDYAAYPRTAVFIVLTFITMLIFYVIGSLLVSGAKEHTLQ